MRPRPRRTLTRRPSPRRLPRPVPHSLLFLPPSLPHAPQVEYAIAAVQNAAAAVGLCTSSGVVLCVEKQVTSKLLAPQRGSDKVHTVDAHVFAATAGLASDASILVNYARLCAQRFAFQFGEPQPVEALVQLLCDYKHSYTQYGGLRPFGVAFLYAGWDRHNGFQL